MPLLTFIITYHNEPWCLLRECLQSIQALPLTCEEREIILVDDGSDVSVEEEVRECAEDVRYLRQPAQGLSVARNNALDVAQGKYIQFVDADDALLSHTYGRVLNLLKEEQPDMVMFRFTHENTENLQDHLPVCRTDGVSLLRQQNMRASACCYVFGREVAGDLRFEPNLLHEDELFTPLLMLKVARPESLLSTLYTPYFYRVHGETITHGGNDQHIARRLDDAFRILQMLKGHAAELDRRSREALNRRVAQLTMDYIYNVYRLTRSKAETGKRMRELRQSGFFPLPLKCYTIRYFLFSLCCRMVTLFI